MFVRSHLSTLSGVVKYMSERCSTLDISLRVLPAPSLCCLMLHWQCLNTLSCISISHACFPGDWPFPRCKKPVRARPGIISSCLFLFVANCFFSHFHFSADHLLLSFGLSLRFSRHLPGSEDLSFSKELGLLEFNTWIQVFPLGPASWKFHSE